MLTSCTQKYTDESDERAFRFTFYCDRCGKPYKGQELSFMGGQETETECEKELWELKWQKEHTQAFERANHDASYHFFCCPGCGEYVCSDCTVSEKLPSGDVRDLCRKCNVRQDRRKNSPMRMVSSGDSPKKSKKKGWRSLWPTKSSRRSQDE